MKALITFLFVEGSHLSKPDLLPSGLTEHAVLRIFASSNLKVEWVIQSQIIVFFVPVICTLLACVFLFFFGKDGLLNLSCALFLFPMSLLKHRSCSHIFRHVKLSVMCDMQHELLLHKC